MHTLIWHVYSQHISVNKLYKKTDEKKKKMFFFSLHSANVCTKWCVWYVCTEEYVQNRFVHTRRQNVCTWMLGLLRIRYDDQFNGLGVLNVEEDLWKIFRICFTIRWFIFIEQQSRLAVWMTGCVVAVWSFWKLRFSLMSSMSHHS